MGGAVVYKRSKDRPQSHDPHPDRKTLLRSILPAPDIIKRIMAYQDVREHSHRELADKLNLEGVRDANGRLWTGSSVHAVLQGQLHETLTSLTTKRATGKSRPAFRVDGRTRAR